MPFVSFPEKNNCRVMWYPEMETLAHMLLGPITLVLDRSRHTLWMSLELPIFWCINMHGYVILEMGGDVNKHSFSVKLCNPVSSIFDLCILVTFRNAYKGLHYWAWKLVGDWIHFDFATHLLCEQTIFLLLMSQLVSSDEGWGLWKWVNACEILIKLMTGSTQFSSLNQISRLLAL